MSRARYYHDGAWHDIGGDITIPGFRAQLVNSTTPDAPANDTELIRWDEWQFINTTDGAIFDPVVISGGAHDGRFATVLVREPGLYLVSCKVVYENFFPDLHAVIMSDGYDFKSLVYGNNLGTFTAHSHAGMWIRRYPPQDEDFVSPGIYAGFLFEYGNGDSVSQGIEGDGFTSATEFEVWQLTP